MNRVLLTPLGFEMLQKQLEHLKKVERPKNIQEIEKAREFGDLSENAEYQYAKDQQGLINAKIMQIEDQLARAEVIDPAEIESDRVLFGATVTLYDLDTGEEETYTIVGSPEADLKLNRISVNSPLAKEMLGKEIGDEVVLTTSKGKKYYEIVEIEYKPLLPPEELKKKR